MNTYLGIVINNEAMHYEGGAGVILRKAKEYVFKSLVLDDINKADNAAGLCIVILDHHNKVK